MDSTKPQMTNTSRVYQELGHKDGIDRSIVDRRKRNIEDLYTEDYYKYNTQ